MAQAFNCPNCNAPLEFSGSDLTVRCPFCGSSVIAPESLHTAAPTAPPPVVGLDALIGQADHLREAVRLIQAGDKIGAIKAYRQAFGVGLAEAKEAVEKLSSGLPVVMPGRTSASDQADIERQVDRLVRAGNNIEAIKVYRQAYDTVGLKDAKAAVEKFASTGHLDIPDPTVQPAEAAEARQAAPADGDPHAAAQAEIERFLRAGQKIEAIKAYRLATLAGLKEAKDAVEAFQAGGALVFTAPPAPAVKRREGMPANAGAQPQTRGGITGWLLFFGFCITFAVVMTLGGSFLWPNTLRLGAPILCPRGYDDAWGVRAGGLALTCFTDPDRTFSPNLYLVWMVMFGFYFLLGLWFYFIGGFIRMTGGGFMLIFLLPLATLLLPLFFFATEIPAPYNANTFWLLFSDRLGTRVKPSQTETLFSRLTLAYASQTLAVGGKGVAPGYFDDARTLAVDSQGRIYVGEYSSGRVQVFDADGNFLSQWQAGGQSVAGLAAGQGGSLYVISDSGLSRHDGLTGERQATLGSADQVFYAMAATPDGQLVAVTDKALVWFSSAGQLTRTGDPLSELLGQDTRVNSLAVDTQGNLYLTAPGRYEVVILSPEGKLIKRFGGQGDADDQFRVAPSTLAVDAAGRILVDGRGDLAFFDRNGALLGDTGIGSGASRAAAFTPQGRLLVLDGSDDRLLEYQMNR